MPEKNVSVEKEMFSLDTNLIKLKKKFCPIDLSFWFDAMNLGWSIL